MSEPVNYLLDTNILSETRKKQPDWKVIEFLNDANAATLYVSVLTLGELRKGVAQKHRTDPVAAQKLAEWVDGLELSFADRIVGIDAATARQWGEWSAERPRPVVDTLLAATAFVHRFTLVTRNTKDMPKLPGRVHNPFSPFTA